MPKWLMDVTLKVKTDCELVNLIGEDTDLTIEDIRRVDGIYVSHLISISLDQVERFKELLSELNLKLEILNISKQKCFVCINKYSCTPCRIIANNNAFMISGGIDRDGYIEYRFVSSFESFRRILRELHRADLSFRVNRVVRYKPKGILTETQERILLIALRAGFFDFPRRVALEELARGIGVFPSTLSEVIRRGLYMRY